MVRARAAFEVCKFAVANAAASALEAGVDHRQLYAEDEISEDIELGTRLHASGYKSVFLCEKLATGEVRRGTAVSFAASSCRQYHLQARRGCLPLLRLYACSCACYVLGAPHAVSPHRPRYHLTPQAMVSPHSTGHCVTLAPRLAQPAERTTSLSFSPTAAQCCAGTVAAAMAMLVLH
jgi:hypothetical protein